MNSNKPPVTCETLPCGTLGVEQAQSRILQAIHPLQEVECVALIAASGRVLAQDVAARQDVPPHTNSAMDGYALRQQDLTTGQPLRLVGSAFAGHPFDGTLGPGECIRIMTGAMLPAGADSVAMQENVEREGETIRILGALKPGENVRHTGEDSRRGEVLLEAGHKLNAADLGLLASQGIAEVAVRRRPRVAICSTGDELKGVGETLQPGEIHDSNRYTLHAMLAKLDVEVIDMGIVHDTPEAIEAAFERARREADVLITSGGVSVGEADYVTDALQRLGQVNFWKIAFKPGKPLAVGALGDCHFFGLPGNPVSVMATFLLFVRPALLQLRGEALPLVPEYRATTVTPLKKAPGRKEYQRAVCEQDTEGHWQVSTTGNQGSHVLRSMSQANCFAVLPLEWGDVAPGTEITIIPFEGLL